MAKKIIEIEHLRAGQPRPYADSVYVAKIHSKNFWDSTTGPREGGWHLNKEDAKVLAKMFVQDFKEGSEREWHHAKLTQLDQDAEGTWTVTVISPYLD